MKFENYFKSFQELTIKLPSEINDKINLIRLATNSLRCGRYPSKPLPFLPLNETEITKIIELNFDVSDLENQITQLDHLFIDFRSVVRENMGIYCILNEKLLDELLPILKSPILEIAAGNGFLSSRLSKRGFKITAVDNGNYQFETKHHKKYFPVVKSDAVKYMNNHLVDFQTILLSWAPDNEFFDWEILQLIRKSRKSVEFVIIGERNGKTNSSKFWQDAHFINLKKMIRLNQNFLDFDLYRDRIYMVE